MSNTARARNQDVSIDDLKDDIRQLRKDLSQLSRAVVDKAEGNGSDMAEEITREGKEALRRAKERSEEVWNRARSMSDETVKEIEHKIEERPFASMLLMLFAGMLLGKLVGRS